MPNARGRGPSDDEPEPDPTIPQVDADADQDGDLSGDEPERTMIQGGDRTVKSGEGRGRGSLDRTVKSASGRSADAPAPKAAAARSAGAAATSEVKGRIFASRFEVIEKLGEGGMGVVYRAHDREIEGREIALKVLRPRFSRSASFRELFFREIHAAQGFVSEHVVQVRDTGKAADGTLFLTMDLVDGEPLDAVLSRESSLNERHALEIARQTLLALASGHDQGFVHRDIKPSNVMLLRRVPKTDENPFGVGVRVLDFGIAALTAQMEEGQVIGTPRYMSPEQVQGQRLDGRSDLFSVGVMLYEMLSGTRPFEGDTPEELRTAILETNVAPMITEIGNLSEPIRKILKKALQKNRDKRFQSAADFANAIVKSSAFREKRGTPAWVGGMLLLTMAAAGAEGWLIWDQRKEYDKLEREMAGIGGQHAREIDALRAEHQGVLDGKSKELEEMRSQKDDAISAQRTAALEAEQARQSRFAAEKARDEALRKEQTLEQQIRELRERVDKQDDAMKPDVVAGELVDTLVRLIDGGSPQSALATLEEKKTAIPETEGAAHLRHVVVAAAALDAAAKVLLPGAGGSAPTTPPSTEVRNEAQQSYERGIQNLAQANASVGDFELLSAKWIRSKRLGRTDEPARLADLAQIRDRLQVEAGRLKTRIDEMRIELESVVAAERAALLKLSRTDDPAPLIRHMGAFPAELADLTGLVDRLGAETETYCTTNGSRLNLELLATTPSLRQWGEYLIGDGAQVQGKGAATFRWLWAARQWQDGDKLAGPEYAFMDPIPAIVNAEPHADWRAQIALQRAFARNFDQFLDNGQGVSVYRQRNLSSGKLDWYHELLQKQPGVAGSWEIVRKRIDDEGVAGRDQTISVSLRPDAFLIADVPALEVRAYGDHISVAQWQPRLVEPLPEQAWTRGMNHPRFRAAVANGLPCLVIDSGNTKFWFSPGYGLVRQEIPGVFERELCYTARAR